MSREHITLTALLVLVLVGLGFGGAWLARAQTAGERDASSLAHWLALTPEQTARLQEVDPAFARDAAAMAGELYEARQVLATLLEAEDTTDMQILEQVEQVIAAHNALERRVAAHLVRLRHELEPASRQQLGREAAREVRRGMGRRWGGPGRGAGMGGGRGRGMGGRGEENGDGGRMRQAIDELFAHHQAIERHVEPLPNGVLTTTTSDEPQVAEALRLHVRQMKQRLVSGRPMRRGDPLFRELFEYHDRIEMHIEDAPGGVRVRQTSDDEQVVLLIRAHAEVVTEFIEQGPAREHRMTPLPEGYGVTHEH